MTIADPNHPLSNAAPSVAPTQIHVLGLAGEGWSILFAPTEDRPCWSDDHGSRHALRGLLASVDAATADQITAAHVAAVARLTELALTRLAQGQSRAARRLAAVTSHLVEEIAGLWPPGSAEPA